VERAGALAAFGQALARCLVETGTGGLDADLYRVYGYNRFLACRFGLEAELVDVERREKVALRDDLLDTLQLVRRFASDASGAEALDQLAEDVQRRGSDSAWLRETYRRTSSLSDVVRSQCEVWQSGLRVLEP
jgi:carboxylate-amine ligase